MDNLVKKELLAKYRENKLAHAYLIETNNVNKALADTKEFIKIINCQETYKQDCSKCNICNLIDKNNLPSLKIITPDGTSIKKSQTIELKENFMSIPLYSKYNVYIMNKLILLSFSYSLFDCFFLFFALNSSLCAIKK